MSIDDIKARLAAATPGPWAHDGCGEIAQRATPWGNVVSAEVSCISYCYGGSAKGIARESDAEFIAHAPEDIARLIAALEAAGGALEKHGNPDASLYDDEFNKGYCAGRKALRAIVEEAITEALESPSE